MKKRLLILVLLTVALTASAQQHEIDSITALLPQLSDSARLVAMGKLTELSIRLPSESYYLRMYLEEARRQKNIAYEGLALLNLTSHYFAQTDNDSVFIFGEEAIRFNRQHKQYSYMSATQRIIINRYQLKEQIITALRKAEEAYAEAKELQDDAAMADMLDVMANIYHTLEQYEEAVRYATESVVLTLKIQLKDPSYIAAFGRYDVLVELNKLLNRPLEMLRYADSMLVEIDRINRINPAFYTQDRRFHTECHRAIAYAEMKQSEQSLQAIRNAETLFDPQWGVTYFTMRIDEIYGAYYLSTGAYDKAITHLMRVLNYYEDNATTGSQDIPYFNILMAQAYFEKGDHRNAAETYRHVIQISRERNRKQFYEQINELRTIYELDKAEKETERRQAAIQRQRTLITALSVVCLALTLVVAIIAWSRRRIAEKNRGLYRQIKEQDRIAEALIESKTQHTPLSKDEKEAEQQEFIMRLRERVLSDRYSANPEADIDKLVASLNTNRSYLYKTVKNMTGQTVQDYLNTVRLDEARRLLDTSGELIETVAWMSGFNSIRTFYRVFRDRYNMTPTDYRKSAQV